MLIYTMHGQERAAGLRGVSRVCNLVVVVVILAQDTGVFLHYIGHKGQNKITLHGDCGYACEEIQKNIFTTQIFPLGHSVM